MDTLGLLSSVAPEVSFEALKSEHIKAFVKGLVDKGDKDGVNGAVISATMKSLKVSMFVPDPMVRMLEYVHSVFIRLRVSDMTTFGRLTQKKPSSSFKTDYILRDWKIQCRKFSSLSKG